MATTEPPESSKLDHALELVGVKYQYQKSSELALSINKLDVAPQEQVVITGRSGCGKSTLLHLIAGLMDPTEGSISVAGSPMSSMSGSKRDQFRGRHIGMVFQTFHLLNGFTVLENVLAALMFSDFPRSEHRSRAKQLIERLGINTPSARIQDLSVGQQQRVAVARAIACSPKIVLADEPTAALDPEFTNVAMDLLQDACRSIGASLVCVTHDLSIVERFDRHVSMQVPQTQEHA
jgi:ABC-type lipoprotein export system ATPase subunit